MIDELVEGWEELSREQQQKVRRIHESCLQLQAIWTDFEAEDTDLDDLIAGEIQRVVEGIMRAYRIRGL